MPLRDASAALRTHRPWCYKYSCPRFWARAHAAGEPRRFFTFLFPPRGTRGRRPVTPESKHVTLPKGIAPTKKRGNLDPQVERGGRRGERWYRGSSLKRGAFSVTSGPSIVVHYSIAAARKRVRATTQRRGIELTRGNVSISLTRPARIDYLMRAARVSPLTVLLYFNTGYPVRKDGLFLPFISERRSRSFDINIPIAVTFKIDFSAQRREFVPVIGKKWGRIEEILEI